MRKIAVYKTNVENSSKATAIAESIRRQFPDCEASFDLEDCDKVLRIERGDKGIDPKKLRKIAQEFGIQLDILH